jgi:secondary thiamine-phosphate synthase enzyme
MHIVTSDFQLKTRGDTDIIDITPHVREKVQASRITDGSTLVFIAGSTAGLTTIEYEGGVINDLRQAIEKIAPKDIPYEHDKRWGDGNGFSHVRAALVGASLTVPIAKGELVLGTWQQIVLLDFDNRPRTRRVVVQTSGNA